VGEMCWSVGVRGGTAVNIGKESDLSVWQRRTGNVLQDACCQGAQLVVLLIELISTLGYHYYYYCY
jgi:hypothetical protein